GPPVPKTGALPGCATSRTIFFSGFFLGPSRPCGGMRYRAALHPELFLFRFLLGPSRPSAGCTTSHIFSFGTPIVLKGRKYTFLF
ncbi:MAG: hypothetical protein ABJC12_05940, partial [Saprospiraceae bacterium]